MGGVLDTLLVMIDPSVLLMMSSSVAGGLIIGAIPGLNATMAMALLAPLTFVMDSSIAIMLLCSVYVGALSGGLYSAILLRIPGTSSSIATTFDGFPMARKGLAGEAIGAALISSFIGGTFSFLFLGFFAPILSKVALKFGPAEYFAVSLLGLSTIASVLGTSTLKGLISACLGLIIGVIGIDVLVGTPRYNFGRIELMSGFDVMIILIGLFAIPQILHDLSGKSQTTALSAKLKIILPSLGEMRAQIGNFIRSSLIGTWIGLLPGAGGSIASLLAYDRARRSSKHPKRFGKGEVSGVIASETANNAVIGGSLIPLLTLGIPGDTPAAVLLAAFIIHGIQAGPMMFVTHPETIRVVLMSLYASNILMIIISLIGSRYLIRVLRIPKYLLLPLIIIMCMVGSYALNQRIFDIWVMVGIGFLGYFMEAYKFPVAPAVLGVVLGPIIESSLRRALQISDNGFVGMIARPITLVILIVVALNFLWPFISQLLKRRKHRHGEDLASDLSDDGPEPQSSEAIETVMAVGAGNGAEVAAETELAVGKGRLVIINRIIGIGLAAIAVLLYVSSYSLATLALESPIYGPGFYPRIIAVCLFLLSVVLVIKPRQKGEAMDQEGQRRSYLLISMGMIVVLVLALKYIGFVVSSIVFLVVSFIVFSGKRTRKTLLSFTATGIIFTVVVFLLFERVLGVFLPHGFLF